MTNISPNVVIMTRDELSARETENFNRGYMRGKFESCASVQAEVAKAFRVRIQRAMNNPNHTRHAELCYEISQILSGDVS